MLIIILHSVGAVIFTGEAHDTRVQAVVLHSQLHAEWQKGAYVLSGGPLIFTVSFFS